MCTTSSAPPRPEKEYYNIATLTVAFLLISIASMFPFWIGKLFMLYTGEGSDSITAFWPFSELALRWASAPSEWLPELGYGTPAIAMQGYGFLNPLTLAGLKLGKMLHSVAYGHFIIFTLHAYIACIGVYLFFVLYKAPKWVAFFLALIYAYSPFLVGFGSWDIALNVVPSAFIPLILLSVEYYLQKKKWIFLPWPVALLAISNCGPYIIWQAFIFIYFYVTFRCVDSPEVVFNEEFTLKKYVVTVVKTYCGLLAGILFAAFCFIPFLYYGFTDIARTGGNIIVRDNYPFLWVIYRIFDTVAFIPDSYYANIRITFYGMPFYALSLLVMPALFITVSLIKTKKQFWAIFILLSPWILALVSPHWRAIIHMLTSYYRFIAIPWSLSVLIIASHGLKQLYTKDCQKAVWATSVIPAYILIVYLLSKSGVELRWLWVAFWVVCLTAVSLLIASKLRYKRLMILAVLCIELGLSTYGLLIHSRPALLTTSPNHIDINLYENNGIAEPLRQYAGHHRFALPALSPVTSYEIANFQSYYGSMGTHSYQSFNIKKPICLLEMLGINSKAQHLTYEKDMPLSLFGVLGVKYIFEDTNKKAPQFFVLVDKTSHDKGLQDISIYENELWTPFGMPYYSCIAQSNWEKLEQDEKILTMYQSIVISDEYAATLSERISSTDTTPMQLDSLIAQVSSRRTHALQIQTFSPDLIEGVINVERDTFLYFPIPALKGWDAYIDGNKTELLESNIAFFSIFLEPGTHTVSLRYKLPLLRESIVISVVSLLIYIILLLRSRRIKNLS